MRGIRQAELEKRRNDEETEEGWVECSRCERWVHQICGLFNKGRNDESVPYICPMCLLEGACLTETIVLNALGAEYKIVNNCCCR